MCWQNELRAVNPRTGKHMRQVISGPSESSARRCSIMGFATMVCAEPIREDGQGSQRAWAGNANLDDGGYLRFSDALMDKPRSYMAFGDLVLGGRPRGGRLWLSLHLILTSNASCVSRKATSASGEKMSSPLRRLRSRCAQSAFQSFLVAEVGEYIELFGIAEDERMFPVSKSYLYHEMSRGCKNSGVKRIGVHDLHTPFGSEPFDFFGFQRGWYRRPHGGEYRYHVSIRAPFPSVQDDMARALDKVGGGGDE